MTRSYSYDAVGNTVADTAAQFTYNNRGRMSSSTVDTLVTTYFYNALGERIEKNNASTTEYFVYDETGHLLGEYGAGGSLIQETIWLGDIPVATVQPGTGGGISIYYIHSDHTNAPKIISSAASNGVVWRWDMDPFGSFQPNTNPNGLGSFTYNLRAPGQYADLESGLNYNYRRDYDSQTGRYMESDPFGLQAGINTYAYATGNPTGRSDRLGLKDYVVAIWSPSAALYSVGHVVVADMNGTVLTSEFPIVTSVYQTNVSLSWSDTLMREDGRWPDHVYSISVSDTYDDAVQKAAATQNASKKWFALPFNWLSQTNCAVGAVKTLSQAGIPGFPEWWLPGLTPSRVDAVMQDLATHPNSGVRSIDRVPW